MGQLDDISGDVIWCYDFLVHGRKRCRFSFQCLEISKSGFTLWSRFRWRKMQFIVFWMALWRIDCHFWVQLKDTVWPGGFFLDSALIWHAICNIVCCLFGGGGELLPRHSVYFLIPRIIVFSLVGVGAFSPDFLQVPCGLFHQIYLGDLLTYFFLDCIETSGQIITCNFVFLCNGKIWQEWLWVSGAVNNSVKHIALDLSWGLIQPS